jgi:hypothetical protein
MFEFIFKSRWGAQIRAPLILKIICSGGKKMPNLGN